MKVLILNGSPRKNGNTELAINELVSTFELNGIQTIVKRVALADVAGCRACLACYKTGKCVINDEVNEVAKLFEECDGLILASPVYYAQPNATLVAFTQRLFYSTRFDKRFKVGASVAIARRGGCSSTFDALNKFFTICGMPVASSQYWNSVHGREKGEAVNDGEGMQTMRTLANNMSFLIKSIALGKEKYGLPQKEERISTNFIK
ncbi:MAG: flavodoxin family protein [Clostridia bacterium]|nr:flavodoxin family protein [Clostridia bacterium]